MKSNYQPIGKYIRLVDERNSNLEVETLLGLTVAKEFIPSVANIIGTDMANYKIIRNNQFACSTMQVRRDKKMPVALLQTYDKAIISPAYPVFEVVDENILLPEYLMMWFTRAEFDREACFYAIGGVRGSLEWDDFLNMKLPVPHIDKQREIVQEYKTITDRIELNKKLCQKLEETAQAIYREWFVEGIDKENLPEGWRVGKLGEIAHIIMGQSPESETYNKDGRGMIFYQGRTDFGFRYPEITTYTTEPKKKAFKDDILISVRAPVGDLNIAIEDCAIGRGVGTLKSKHGCNSYLFYTLQYLKPLFDVSDGDGTIFGSITKDDLNNMEVVYLKEDILTFDEKASKLDKVIKIKSIENHNLNKLKELLLSKLTKIGG